MNPTRFELRFSDFKLAESLGEIKWPDGINVRISKPLFRASPDSHMIVRVVIDFSGSVSLKKLGISAVVPPILLVICRLIVKKLKPKVKRRKNKKTRINNQISSINIKQMLLLAENEIAAQNEREIQKSADNSSKNPNKKNDS